MLPEDSSDRELLARMDSLSIAGLGAQQERFTLSQAHTAPATLLNLHMTALAGVQTWFWTQVDCEQLNCCEVGTFMRMSESTDDRQTGCKNLKCTLVATDARMHCVALRVSDGRAPDTDELNAMSGWHRSRCLCG